MLQCANFTIHLLLLAYYLMHSPHEPQTLKCLPKTQASWGSFGRYKEMPPRAAVVTRHNILFT